ncbi:PIR Superfamily Protein [Plasmodium ovale curtisi]|uniref:PIR Superfamily Protein n=1 Tax=Plasmodium ovale curtisi TaxID=864141 RepID=A0A1A8WH55_PLAOA|nr:PIR Superfamily Protein [Plasmodium ovale curtisi]
MSCDIVPKFDYYGPLAKSLGKKSSAESEITLCNSFPGYDKLTYVSYPHRICEQFKNIHNLLYNRTPIGKEANTLSNKDCSFLNHWLNVKLRSDNLNAPISVKEFYDSFITMDKKTLSCSLCQGKFYNIESYHFENISTLYNLYNSLRTLNIITEDSSSGMSSRSCYQYSKECYQKYIEGIINCYRGCDDFYNVLKKFKNKYEEISVALYTQTDRCKSTDIIPLPDYVDVLSEYKTEKIKRFNSIVTIPILVPIFGIFFKLFFVDTLAPFRQFLYNKIKKIKNMWITVSESGNELIHHISNMDNTTFDHGEYNIGYYTARNF